ncbi:hypothetical protein B0F90DRAFT_1694095 [Multifurca ochricompacta]|uniref:F-box domain-containing protein n=1 Tax=Multifurca ochricompacta TaxID=376703 RepID=A0AAD4MB77_9AGAM|nr:hypothetical protein B0F90DRAFT_1694095 [Multifurca ochricompacta]
MHPVLLLDEVLRIILDNIDRDPIRSSALKTFYHLATVCRAWKDPSLDYLWASLSSIDPLLALLPHHVPHNCLPPHPLPQFHAYASRVRNLGQSACPLPRLTQCPDIVDAIASGSVILPALRSVRLVLKDATRHELPLTLYLSRTLQSVSVDVGFRSNQEKKGLHDALHVYLDTVAHIASDLKHLHLRGQLSDQVVNSVASMRELRSLCLCGGSQLMPRTLASIARFSRLEDLRLQLDCPNIADLVESFGSADFNTSTFFPSLRNLRIRVSPATAEVLFAHLPEGKLRTVHLESDLKPRSVDSWTPALEILAERTHSSLTDLSFEAMTSFCEAFDDAFPPKLHFTLATLAPLGRLVHLRRFTLDSSVPPDLSDADLATIASWWPEIEELFLWSRPVDAFDFPTYFTAQPRATPTSLSFLASRCPRLCQLSLPMDVAVLPLPAHPPLAVASQTALRRLTIGCVRIGKTIDPAGLAECVYRAFPALKDIEFDCSNETSWADVLECYFGFGGRVVQV